MNALGSLILGIAALLPLSRRNLNTHIRRYCFVTSIHGSLQGMLLLSGISIASYAYGIEWYAARIAQFVFGVLYTFELTSRNRRLLVGGVVSFLFAVTPLPTMWFNWLSLGYGFLLLFLGISIVGASRIVGTYWISMGAWQYAFLRLSPDPVSIIWRLNWFLPSAISIIAFIAVAIFAPLDSRHPVADHPASL